MAAIGRFQKGAEIFYGKVVDGEIYCARGDVFGSPAFDRRPLRLKGVRTLAPVVPSKVIAVGLNYEDHARETKLDPRNLTVQLFQNGQLRQNSSTRHLIFNCHQLVSFISANMTLLPGDIILTGTPGGVGPIACGDRLEVRIQGLAPLLNTVK